MLIFPQIKLPVKVTYRRHRAGVVAGRGVYSTIPSGGSADCCTCRRKFGRWRRDYSWPWRGRGRERGSVWGTVSPARTRRRWSRVSALPWRSDRTPVRCSDGTWQGRRRQTLHVLFKATERCDSSPGRWSDFYKLFLLKTCDWLGISYS